jgi:hypothetical protein
MKFLLGSDAFKFVQDKLEDLKKEFALWEKVTRSTNFDQ